jgi:hypothetical protein
MTAIIGFGYLDGVLMLADTEETTSGYTKSECDKLYRFIFPQGTVVTGGAGDSHFIDCANQELFTFMQKFNAKKSWHVQLSKFTKTFWKESIMPHQRFPQDLIPNIEMLIAINANKKTALFRWHKNKLLWVPAYRHVSIGCGEVQIHPMLRDVQFPATWESTLFYGIRMMFHAKRIVQFVGGKTEAIVLSNDGLSRIFNLETTQKIEDLVVNFEQFIDKVIYSSVSNVSQVVKGVDENVADFLHNSLPTCLHQYREEYRRILAPQTNSAESKE